MVIKNISSINEFFKLESSGGILLMIAAVLAIIFANSPLSGYYDLLLDTPVEIRIGALEIDKPLLLWINDGLMAVFFLLVGLELKRELVEGELSDKSQIMLPAIGAIGGMLMPALIYTYFNHDDPVAMKGWAIPAATDIAFALGILSLLGSRVPVSLKIFLTAVAIFDDLGAIVIIAVFYTENISFYALVVVACCIVALVVLNKRNEESKSLYFALGAIMWTAMLKSGVHATLAGVILAMAIPLNSKSKPDYSPLKSLENDLHSLVAFFILPVFAFSNAGLDLSGMTIEQVMHPVPLGIATALFLGKQLGVFGFCWLAIKFKIAQMPNQMDSYSLYATALLCGVGFTMSLFIGSLAFEETSVNLIFDERLGIIIGSLLSGTIGYFVLNKCLPPKT